MAIYLRSTARHMLFRQTLPLLCFPTHRSASQDVKASVLVPMPEITAFIERCMIAAGTKPSHAKALANNLTMADYRGHFSHGLNRLGKYSY